MALADARLDMAREFPDWINPWKAAEGQRTFSGTVPLSRLERLRPLLESSDGEVGFKARFYLDSQRRAIVEIEVTAELPLRCQVSLEEYTHRVQRTSQLTVIEDEMGQLDLPEDHEATCTEDGRLSLASLAEDECILAIPQVPRKPGLKPPGSGAERDTSAGQKTYKPFAVLEKLLNAPETDQDSDSS